MQVSLWNVIRSFFVQQSITTNRKVEACSNAPHPIGIVDCLAAPSIRAHLSTIHRKKTRFIYVLSRHLGILRAPPKHTFLFSPFHCPSTILGVLPVFNYGTPLF